MGAQAFDYSNSLVVTGFPLTILACSAILAEMDAQAGARRPAPAAADAQRLQELERRIEALENKVAELSKG